MRKAIRMMMISIVLALSGCAGALPMIGAGAGVATVGGIAYWLLNQPWSVKICYWVGNEAALKIMPAASTNIDADTIAVCGDCVAYLEKSQGLPAADINAELAARLSKLPAAQVSEIQTAATILDEFLPAATSLAPLTAGEVADIEGFFKGYADGTQTCLSNSSASVARALAKATSKKAELQRKHTSKIKAGEPTGWLVIVSSSASVEIGDHKALIGSGMKVIDIPPAK